MPVRAGPLQQNSKQGYYRNFLNISYKNHVMNEKVRDRIQKTLVVHDNLLTMVKKRKLRWYRHSSISSGMATTILQGTVKGKRRRRRQKRWENNIKEWTGMECGDSLRASEDMKMWKDLVATSSVVPRQGLSWDEMKWVKLVSATKIDSIFTVSIFKFFISDVF